MIPIINLFYDTAIERMKREISQKKNLSMNFNIGIKEQKKNRGISF
jgi:hypothetical protein